MIDSARYCYQVRSYQLRACQQYCQSDMHGQCLIVGQTMYVPCGPSAESCLTRQLSTAAFQSHEAAAAGLAGQPTQHLTMADHHSYNSPINNSHIRHVTTN